MIRRKGGLLILMLGIFITAGLGVAGAQNFADNPSPFPFVSGPDGTGVQLSGVLVSEEGALGTGSFFRQEFVTLNVGAGNELFIHDIMEDGAVGSGNEFLQESFVAMGNQRNPFTNQTNTSMPAPTAPGFTQISFRQTLVAGGLTMNSSLDRGEEILIDQTLTGIPTGTQEPGTAASTIRIAQNGGPGGTGLGALPTCAGGSVFCTTINQTVDVQSGGVGSVSVFNQNMTFTTGGSPVITQIP